MCVSRDGTLLVAAGWKTVRAWKVPAESPCKIPALLQLEDRVGIAALSADGQWLATGSGTNRPGLWNMNAQDPAVSRVLLSGYELMTEGSSISALMFSPDGQWLMTGSHDGIVRMWNLSLESLLILAADCTGRELTPAERRDYLLDL